MRRLAVNRFVWVGVIAVTVAVIAVARVQGEAAQGFDRPHVIDRKMERDVAALTKRVVALEKQLAELKASQAE